jgi:Family of unknown function (DUF6502)
MGNFPIYDSSMSRSFAKPSPASAAGATSSISVAAAMGLFAPLLRLIVRLAIKSGLKYAEIDQAVRVALVEEAQAQCDDSQRMNASRLSVMTGLHRKDVSMRLGTTSKLVSREQLDLSVAMQVFSRWAFEVRRNKRAKTLPVNEAPRAMSFAQLARAVVTDVHPRAVLDELVRLGFVAEQGGSATLLAKSFRPSGAADDRLRVFSDNALAMIRTGIENVLDTRPRQPEYAIWGKGVSFDDAKRISDIAVEQWQVARDALFQAISDAPESAPGEVAHHVRVGMYVNYEPLSEPIRSE